MAALASVRSQLEYSPTMDEIAAVMREGGAVGGAAALCGVVGVLFASLALAALALGRKEALALGLSALLLAALAAGIGLGGTVRGRRESQRSLAAVENVAARERLIRLEHRSLAAPATLASWAGAAPLLLGLVAALGAVRRGRPAETPNTSPLRSYLLVGLAASAALALLGGARIARAEAPPRGRYALDDEDSAGWRLAIAREAVDKYPDPGCEELELALDELTAGREPRAWSRDPGTVVPDWRPVATRCAQRIWGQLKTGNRYTYDCKRPLPGTIAPGSAHTLECLKALPRDRETLLRSPLLVDEALRAEITAAR